MGVEHLCTYIHEVGQPLYWQCRGRIAVWCPGAAGQRQQLFQRLAVVANQPAHASGFMKGDSEI